MKRYLMVVPLVLFVVTYAYAQKAKGPVEADVSASSMGKIADIVRSSVKWSMGEAMLAKQGAGGWEYMAKRMRPPKNEKWRNKWNELGKDGWESIDHFENVYIFKRPAVVAGGYEAPKQVEQAPVLKETPVEQPKPAVKEEKVSKPAKRRFR